MTSDELEDWLKTSASTGSGWTKDDGSGESVGHESGRHIVDILKNNPTKDPGMQLHIPAVLGYLGNLLSQTVMTRPTFRK